MASRNIILESIKKNKPKFSGLPEVPLFISQRGNLVQQFVDAAQKNGSTILTNPSDLEHWIKINYSDHSRVLSLVPEYPGSVYPDPLLRPKDLKHIDLAILPSPLGVAENGAVWVSETECQWRILPFIAENLLICLKKDRLKSNMHEAYESVRINATGFGVFIGGPSKTADIEQSLVVGAQGSRSHTILLL